MGNPDPENTEWLKLTPKDKMPQPDKVYFPRPPKAPDGTLLYERIPNKGEIEIPKDATSPVSLKRRHPDDLNGVVDNSKFVNSFDFNILHFAECFKFKMSFEISK